MRNKKAPQTKPTHPIGTGTGVAPECQGGNVERGLASQTTSTYPFGLIIAAVPVPGQRYCVRHCVGFLFLGAASACDAPEANVTSGVLSSVLCAVFLADGLQRRVEAELGSISKTTGWCKARVADVFLDAISGSRK